MASRPPTPGEHLQTQYLFPPTRTAATLASEMGVPVSTVEGVLAGTVKVDETLARQLAAAMGTTAQLWLDLEAGRGLGTPEWQPSSTGTGTAKGIGVLTGGVVALLIGFITLAAVFFFIVGICSHH